MGRRQGGGRFFDQAEAAGAEGACAGSPFGLDQIRAGCRQINGQLLLLVQGQRVGHGHRQHHRRQQGAGATGELQHLSRREETALGVEAVVVADLHHAGAGGHGSREQLRLHR